MSAALAERVNGDEAVHSYVTVLAGGQTFGLPIERVRDVFVLGALTRVPLAPPEIAGLLNLRGRILTAVDLLVRLGLPASTAGERRMAVGVDLDGECFGLIVDDVGDVLRLACDGLDDTPVNLDPRWTALVKGVHRLGDGLLIVLDVDALLDIDVGRRAA